VDADEAGEIAARRAIESLGAAGGERREGRSFDPDAIMRRDMVGDLGGGGLAGLAIDRFQAAG